MAGLVSRYRYVVVGAGIAGLGAATALIERGVAGDEVAIVDKGRQVGGRMATRRFAGTRFDTGAQFFTATRPAFRDLIERAAAAGAVTEWYSRPARDGSGGFPVWRGSDGMTALPKWIAAHLRGLGVTIALEQRVEGIHAAPDAVTIRFGAGEPIEADHVIVTAPAPQAHALLAPHHLEARADDAVEFVPCIAALLHCRQPIAGLVNRHGWCEPGDARVGWIADNATKGVADRSAMALTFHLAPAPSAQIARESPPDRDHHTRQLLTDWADAAGRSRVVAALHDADGAHFQVKYWRYARAVGSRPEPYYRLVAPRVTLAGDSWSASRVESAYVSGRAAGMAVP